MDYNNPDSLTSVGLCSDQWQCKDYVTFHLITSDKAESLIVNLRNAKYLFPKNRIRVSDPIFNVSKVKFDPRAPTKCVNKGILQFKLRFVFIFRFIIPGWRKTAKSRMNSLISMTYLRKQENINLFNVDWSEESMTLNYLQSCLKIQTVAKNVADFIDTLIMNGLSPDKISIIGHSLGAHIAGVVGKHLHGELSSIVGLDPAGPLFYFLPDNIRLSSSAAKYVEVIHTNGQYLGMLSRVGHVDFYPNGGLSQPNCILDMFTGCSHARSTDIFAESLISGVGFWAKRCNNSVDEITRNVCDNPDKVQMMMGGNLKKKRKIPGLYFLETNAESPYALGPKYDSA